VDPKPYLALANCTERTPTVRFEEARAPNAPYTPGFAAPAPGRQPQLADAQPARNVTAAPPVAFLSGPMDRRAYARPGGLLD